MDLRRLRFPEYDGERLTVRLRHADRQRLRRVADAHGLSESALVRQAVSVLLDVFDPEEQERAKPRAPTAPWQHQCANGLIDL